MKLLHKKNYILIMMLSFIISFVPFNTKNFNSFCENFFLNITFNLKPKEQNDKYLIINCPKINPPLTGLYFDRLYSIILKLQKLSPDFIILDTDPLITKDNKLFKLLKAIKIPTVIIAPDRKFATSAQKRSADIKQLSNASFTINQKENLEVINFVNSSTSLSVSSFITKSSSTKYNYPYKTRHYFNDSLIKELNYISFLQKPLRKKIFEGKTILIRTGFPSALDKPLLTNIGILKASTLLFNDIETRVRQAYDKNISFFHQKIFLFSILLIGLLCFIKLKILPAVFVISCFFNLQIIFFAWLYFAYYIQMDYLSILLTQVIFIIINISMELRNISLMQETLKDYKILRKNTVLQNKAILSLKKLSELGRLTSGINHEISNPLHNIYNSLKLVLTEEDLAEDTKETLDIAIKEIQRLQKLTKNLKQFSQPVTENKQEININEILEFSLKLLAPSFNSYSISVDKNLAMDKIMIFADPDKVQQVFINILLNSCDVLKNLDNGIIKCTTKMENNNAMIIIKDNGPGISDQVRSEIFQEFFTTKGTEGSGLGLYVSYEIINNLSGNITISRNNNQRGAEFIISIPTD